MVISESMAKQFWPQSDPVGELITIGGKTFGPEFEEPPRQIIGVVADVRDIGLNSSPEPTMYVPIPQLSDGITATHEPQPVHDMGGPHQSRTLFAELRISSGNSALQAADCRWRMFGPWTRL